jgi:hypothetical protein
MLSTTTSSGAEISCKDADWRAAGVGSRSAVARSSSRRRQFAHFPASTLETATRMFSRPQAGTNRSATWASVVTENGRPLTRCCRARLVLDFPQADGGCCFREIFRCFRRRPRKTNLAGRLSEISSRRRTNRARPIPVSPRLDRTTLLAPQLRDRRRHACARLLGGISMPDRGGTVEPVDRATARLARALLVLGESGTREIARDASGGGTCRLRYTPLSKREWRTPREAW